MLLSVTLVREDILFPSDETTLPTYLITVVILQCPSQITNNLIIRRAPESGTEDVRNTHDVLPTTKMNNDAHAGSPRLDAFDVYNVLMLTFMVL